MTARRAKSAAAKSGAAKSGAAKSGAAKSASSKSAAAQSFPTKAASYEVGYGKPPQRTQFQKGQSGNPGGRPRQPPALDRVSEMVLEEAFRPVMVEEDGAMVPVEALRAALRSHFGLAISGNYKAQRDVFKAAMCAEELSHTAARREFDDWESSYDEACEEDEEWEEDHAECADDDYEDECRADSGGESGGDDADDEQEAEGEDAETGESRDGDAPDEVNEPGSHAEAGAAVRVSAVMAAPDAVPVPPPAALSRRRRRAALSKARRTKSRRNSRQAARNAWKTPRGKSSAPAEKSAKIPC